MSCTRHAEDGLHLSGISLVVDVYTYFAVAARVCFPWSFSEYLDPTSLITKETLSTDINLPHNCFRLHPFAEFDFQSSTVAAQ
jgi:hypothetical protein